MTGNFWRRIYQVSYEQNIIAFFLVWLSNSMTSFELNQPFFLSQHTTGYLCHYNNRKHEVGGGWSSH
jgi:hypothetical protein